MFSLDHTLILAEDQHLTFLQCWKDCSSDQL